MKVHIRALLALMAMVAPGIARADWLANGNPISVATGDQTVISGAQDGAGGVFVVWLDQRRGAGVYDVYATHVLQDGTVAAGWPANGLALAQTGLAARPWPVADGAGGLLVLWFDQSTYQSRMQSVSGSGVLRLPANGKVLSIPVGGNQGYLLAVASDDSGGVYVQFNRPTDAFGADWLTLTRLTATGDPAPGWTSAGVVVGGDFFASINEWRQLTFNQDPVGGALSGEVIVIEEHTGVSTWGRLAHIAPDSSVTFRTQVIPNGNGTVERMQLAPDGTGGAFANWSLPGPAYYLQHFDSGGNALWPTTTAPALGTLFRDGSGGFYLFGTPPGVDQLEVDRRAGDGSVPAGWDSGVVVTTGSPITEAALLSGSRVYACWSMGTSGSEDVYAVGVTAGGALAPGWQAGGTVVCSASGSQVLEDLVSGSTNDAFALWADRRTGNYDVYAARLAEGGPVVLGVPGAPGASGAALAIERVSPDPARGRAELSLTLPADSPASAEVMDVAGRIVQQLSPEPHRGAQVLMLDVASLPNGVYLARIRQRSRSAVRRFAVLH